MKIRFNLPCSTAFLIAFLTASAPLTAQVQSQETSSPQTSGKLPYEVIVTPDVTRRDLRRLMIEVENDLFQRFNELNLDDDYDIICERRRPTMSHIKRRTCEPKFLIRVRSENASEFAQALNSRYQGWLFSPSTLKREVSGNFEILQEKMEALTTQDYEFRSMAESLLELRSRYENFGEE